MLKKDIKELTELEFEELLLTMMVGVYVRTAVLDSQGRNWKKVDEQLKFFLRLAEGLGYKKLIEYYNHVVLPKETLSKREEKIIEDFNEEEFWDRLEIGLGQRDFYAQLTKDDLEKLKDNFFLPSIVHEYYKKYRKEFEEYGLERLRLVNNDMGKKQK